MKTGEQWLMSIPDKEAVQMIRENIEEQHTGYYLGTEHPSLASFITNSMDWSKTKQGHDYWDAIYTPLLSNAI